jgi:two-component system, chemotaxis family, sensor kinase CheA
MHTLKGNSNMFGYDRIGEFTQHLETIFYEIRSGKVQVTQELLTFSLKTPGLS